MKHKNKNITKVIIIAIALVTLLSVYSCKDGIIDPNENIKPGRRDYVWSVDSVLGPVGTMNRIWGSSPNDIWIASSSAQPAYMLWHYDGYKWEPKSNPNMSEAWSLYGFSETDVWAGGDDGKIWHYGPNKTWVTAVRFFYTPDLNKQIVYYDLWGLTPDNLYAVGTAFGGTDNEHPFIAHYDGTNWEIKHYPEMKGSFIRIKCDSYGNTYILAQKLSNQVPDSTYIYKYNNNTLQKIYSAHDILANRANIQVINGEMIFFIGHTLYHYVSGKFSPILTNLPKNIRYQVYGRTEKDLFFPTWNGITHYNGNDIQYLYEFDNSKMMLVKEGIVLRDNVYFVVDNFTDKISTIIKGKLKK